MKKIILAVACAAASGTIFANSTDMTEQRINLLETELQKLKAELESQKQTQSHLQVKQSQIEENVEKEKQTVAAVTKPSWTDNVKVYGIVRLDAVADFKSSPDSGGRFSGNLYRAPFEDNTRSNHARSDVSISASRLGVSFTSPDKVLSGTLEADFFDSSVMGSGDGKFRIRHAFFNYKDWTFGQTWSLMSNMETRTDSVDYTQFVGTSYTRTPQVRYDWKIDKNNDLKVAMEYTASRVSALPTLTSKYTYTQGPLLAMAQGFVNQKSVDVGTDTVKKVSWGAGGGLKYQITPKQSVQANYDYIVGDQKFMPYTTQSTLKNATSLQAQGDFSLNADKTDLLMNKLNSVNIGYSYKFSPQWRANLSVSLFEYADDTAYAKLNQDANKRLTDYAANVFYSPVQQVDFGVEYHQGKREVFDGRTADVSRINFVSMYKF